MSAKYPSEEIGMDAEAILRKAFPELCNEAQVYELPPSPTPPHLSPSVALGNQARSAATVGAQPPGPSTLGNRFDGIATEIHRLEKQAQTERLAATRWKEQAEQLSRRLQTIEQSEKQLLHQVSEFAQTENSVASERKTLTADLAKTRGELDQYRKAWVAIRKREEAARAALEENARLRTQLETLGHQARQLQAMCHEERARAQATGRHTAALEETMRQIHGKVQVLESRNTHLSTEIQTLHELCKSYETEIARVAEATRAATQKELLGRLEQELTESRAKAAAELKREAAAQEARLETLRGEATQKQEAERARVSAELETRYANDMVAMRAEFERCAADERAKSERAIASLAEARQSESEQAKAAVEKERASSREALATLNERIQAAHAKLEAAHARAESAEENLRELQTRSAHLAATEQTRAAHAVDAQQTAARKLEGEIKRCASLERECDLMRTALLGHFRETRECAVRIEQLTRGLVGADTIILLAQELAARSQIATLTPRTPAERRPSALIGKHGKLDC